MPSKFNQVLGKQVDNSPLILFRICFGFLCAAEAWGAIMTGWVTKTFVEPDFTFTKIGLEWLSMPGSHMYGYFAVMGVFGILIMLGLYYRFAATAFFLMWSVVYLTQKAHYNNHYYFLVLLSAAMIFMPAHRATSLDVRSGRVSKSLTCSRAYILFFVVNIFIVYLYASFNKIHADWINAAPIGIWFKGKADYWLIGPLLAQEWFQKFIAWGGIFYDGLIPFILINRRTRKIGFALSLMFNLFNSAVFQIGIFPYLMISLSAFFYPGASIRKIFFRKREAATSFESSFPQWGTLIFSAYFIIQILLPLRHHLIKGYVDWTEEGHRLSWRMMLRSKSGHTMFKVKDNDSGDIKRINPRDYVTRDQYRAMFYRPDMIWQFAQKLEKIYAEEGKDIGVYVTADISLNGAKRRHLIDEEVDLTEVPWDFFKHSDWILIYDDDRPEK